METFVLFLISAVITAVLMAVMVRRKEQHEDVALAKVAKLAILLGGSYDAPRDKTLGVARGVHRGVTVLQQLVYRIEERGDRGGAAAARRAWTELECPGVAGHPIDLCVRRRSSMKPEEEQPRTRLHDVGFDDEFAVVSSATPEVLAKLLPGVTRSYLTSLDESVGVELRAFGDQCIQLAITGWVVEPGPARAAWDALLAVRTGALAAYRVGGGEHDHADADVSARKTSWSH
jgi:hypothetical protein